VSKAAFKLQSFAKINSSLKILGRREDRYHEIRTVLQAVSLHDDLHFTPRDDQEILLSSDDPLIPLDERNLIVRAANALRIRFGVRLGATIHLEKRVPTKAGLGGASSNAAIALLGLSKLWAINPNAKALMEIASGLGADVPFFLVGGCALATGVGTDVKPIRDLPRRQLVIVVPNVAVSTAEAYEALRAPALTTLRDASILSSSHAERDSTNSDPWALHNDFEQVIFEREPEIERAKAALLEVGARGSLLAGSGSSVFGIFESGQAQELAVKRIRAESGWRIIAAVTMSRREYWQSLGSSGVLSSRFDELNSITGA
jgi:4-diphosphocytidyl-2-C-methyl-D-erythritol kinase